MTVLRILDADSWRLRNPAVSDAERAFDRLGVFSRDLPLAHHRRDDVGWAPGFSDLLGNEIPLSGDCALEESCLARPRSWSLAVR